MTVHSKFLVKYKQSCEDLYIQYQFDMHKEVRERENIEKAEYRSIRKRIPRKEEQKEKLQNKADI